MRAETKNSLKFIADTARGRAMPLYKLKTNKISPASVNCKLTSVNCRLTSGKCKLTSSLGRPTLGHCRLTFIKCRLTSLSESLLRIIAGLHPLIVVLHSAIAGLQRLWEGHSGLLQGCLRQLRAYISYGRPTSGHCGFTSCLARPDLGDGRLAFSLRTNSQRGDLILMSKLRR